MTTKVRKAAASPDGSMTLMGHMKEFRNRLVICAIVFVVTCVVAFFNATTLITALCDLGLEAGYEIFTTAPQEGIIQQLKVTVLAGIIVMVPVALYHIWAFAKPGLKKNENFFFGMVLLFGLVLFCAGVFFAYKITLPFMLNFLRDNTGMTFVTMNTTLQEYINFVVMIFTIFGAVFEMPLITVILSKMGIANPTIMRKGRGVAIILIFLIAAIITPPDIISQFMVGLPMIVLYEISILLSQLTYRKKKDTDDEDEDDEDDEDED